jgi:sortase A
VTADTPVSANRPVDLASYPPPLAHTRLVPPDAPVPLTVPVEPKERQPLSAALLVSLLSLLALSILAIFVVVYALGFSALQEQRSQHQLYAAFRGEIDPSSAIAPSIGGLINPGTPIALINAPQAGLHNVMVVEGTSSSDLMKGPGHLRDTPLPGQVGQSFLLGRSLTAGAPFRHITHLHAGDTITVETGQGTFRYTVNDIRTAGVTKPAIPVAGSVLTLMTSAGSGAFGSLAPGHVVYVDATLQGATAPAPTSPSGQLLSRPIAVPTSELPGHNDPSGWPFVVFWLQALIVAAVAAVWSWMRWGRWQTWLVATPILLGVMWGLSEQAMRLLPNLL